MSQSRAKQERKDAPPDPAKRELKVPGPLMRSFVHEVDLGVIRRIEEIGDLPLMQLTGGCPGGGVIQIEFPAAFTPQVVEAMKQAVAEWSKVAQEKALTDESFAAEANAAKDVATRMSAAASGIEIPVIEVPRDLKGGAS